jgi:hypothetical protein
MDVQSETAQHLVLPGPITGVEPLIIGLVGADETPAVIIVRWPAKPSVFHPHRFPSAADAARVFAAAVVKLAQIRWDRRL